MCETGTNTILLAQEKEGSLKKCFEHILDDDYFWTDSSLVTEKTFEELDFNRWMIRLEKATTDGIMEWNTRGTDTFVDILRQALDKKLFEIHDVLSYLNWLIKTREPQVKYKSAVEKWKEDMKFVESYEEEIREKIKVDSITVKK